MHFYSEEEVQLLRDRIQQLESEVDLLRMHPALAQGLKGERLICDLTESVISKLNAAYDLTTKSGVKLEVKFSKLHTPVKASPNTKRWTWSKPLGWLDKGKDYDFLLLLGEKDLRYTHQYLDRAPYVAFLIPLQRVPEICASGSAIGANVNLTTNFANVHSTMAKVLIEHMLPMTSIQELLRTASTA